MSQIGGWVLVLLLRHGQLNLLKLGVVIGLKFIVIPDVLMLTAFIFDRDIQSRQSISSSH